MTKNNIITVTEDYALWRLDKFLVEKLNLNRSKIQKMIKNSLILHNGNEITKTGIILKINDEIEIKQDDEQDFEEQEEVIFDYKLDIYYEDDDLMVVYKPSGMLTHETIYDETDTFSNALKTYSNNKFQPGIVHRLDKDTSGLLLVSKNEKTHHLLQTMFSERKVIKKYYALVNKPFNINHFFIDVPIGRSNSNKMKMIAGEGKNLKNSLTEVNVLKNWNNYALVELILHTGRTHQIRVHLEYIKHPIVNDDMYSQYRANSDYGQYLMAYYLKFRHPILGNDIEIEIDLEKPFYDFINNIKQFNL